MDAMDATAALLARVRELERIYRRIATTRMAGIPILHPGLEVTAVGFAPEPGGGGAAGVLVTPWFMNLVWLPDEDAEEKAPPPAADGGAASDSAVGREARPPALRVGVSRARRIGHEAFDFLGAHEEGFGPFETCSLFSPVLEFADQVAAVATAEAVLELLRAPPAATGVPGEPAPPQGEPVPARRAFLLGRRAA
jgi:hypothetical protein